MTARPWNAEALERWPGVTIPIHDGEGTYYFDQAEADRAADFFPLFLTHHKGQFAGQAFDLLPWEAELIVRPLFGVKRKRDGLRRFRKVLLFVPKKNGKTQLVAGLANMLLFGDNEPGAEIFVAAADRDQARQLFNEAKAMVEDAPDLASRSDILRNEIVYRSHRSVMKVISAEGRTKHGPNLHGVIIDELHAQPDRDLVETLEKGVAARLQPIIIYVTTAGDNVESIAYEEYDYAKKLITGVIQDDTYLPVIFEAQAGADWRLLETAMPANPSFGITVPAEYYATEITKAINEPRKQNAYKQLHLNIWSQQRTVWIPIEAWDACEVSTLPARQGRLVVAAGIDLSSKIDLTSVCVVIRHDDPPDAAPLTIELTPGSAESAGEPRKTLRLNYSVDLVPFFWMPEDTLHQRAKEDRIPYDLWREQGFLFVTPGNVVDYDAIYEQLVSELLPHYGVKEVAFDPWNAQQFAKQLEAKGYDCTEVPQRLQYLSEPSKAFEALVLSGRVRHTAHPVMRMCMLNVTTAEDRSENIRPVKPSKKARIDGVMAAIFGLSRVMLAEPPKVSVYARGPRPPIWR